jgi:hypothetical protein
VRRDVGDVGHPHLVRPSDVEVALKDIVRDRILVSRIGGDAELLPLSRLDPLSSHQALHALFADAPPPFSDALRVISSKVRALFTASRRSGATRSLLPPFARRDPRAREDEHRSGTEEAEIVQVRSSMPNGIARLVR